MVNHGAPLLLESQPSFPPATISLSTLLLEGEIEANPAGELVRLEALEPLLAHL